MADKLIYHIKQGNHKEVQEMLDDLKDKLKDLKDEHGISILHYATMYGCGKKILLEMITLGCDPNSKDPNGNIPLHYSWESTASPDSYEAFLENPNVRFNTVNNFGDSPLMYALVSKCSDDCIKKLLSKKVELNHPNERNLTPLLEAIRAKRDIEIIKLLIEKGARHDVCDDKGCNIFHLAAEFKHDLKTFEYFSQFDIDLNIPNEWKLTPAAIALDNKMDPEIIKFLLKRTENVNAVSYDNNTLLHYACSRGAPIEIVQMLLEKDINVNIKDNYGNNPLHKLCQNNGSPEIARILIDAGCEVDTKNSVHDTPLHCVCRYDCSSELASALLENGAYVDSLADWDKTPLHVCYEYNVSQDLINLLLENGANVTLQDINNKTPLDFKDNNLKIC